MKKRIIKILSIFSLFILGIVTIINNKVFAATSNYQIASYITFTLDMDVEKGFDLIKPYILYDSSNNLSTRDYEFKATALGDDWYKYTGTYPDGQAFSIQTKINRIESNCGTYVEAELTRTAYRQSIYVTNLKSGKKTSDCLLEAWKDRWMNIKYPSYSVETGNSPKGNIYTNVTTFTSGAAVDCMLCYYAIYDTEINSDVTVPLPETIPLPDSDSNNTQDQNNTANTEDTSSSNNTNDDKNQNKDDNDSTNNDNTKEKDPVLIVLICIGIILGIVLIYIIYKIIRMLLSWLNE